MLSHNYFLYIERSDNARNMSRYYTLEITRTLFGDICLTRRWGRIGTTGQSKAHHFEDEMPAIELFLDLASRKRARGYRPHPRPTSDPARAFAPPLGGIVT
jgi:predicted DNA-binding WGR domain protein